MGEEESQTNKETRRAEILKELQRLEGLGLDRIGEGILSSESVERLKRIEELRKALADLDHEIFIPR